LTSVPVPVPAAAPAATGAAARAGPVAAPGAGGGGEAGAGRTLLGLPPVIGPAPRLLILGSFPGEASLAQARYYAHPRNQFWPILERLLDEPLTGIAYGARLERLKARRIALWDTVGACRREGSLDAAIRDARHNDFDALLAAAAGLGAVAFNGATAARSEPFFAARGLATYRMPSSSPAHAGLSFEAKLGRWRVLRDDGWIVSGAAP
jgi:TDG/mug DNA glycosylase family protein